MLNTIWGGADSNLSPKKSPNNSNQNSTFIFYIFIIFVAIYLINIVVFANFSVIDDHTLLTTLQEGKKIPFFISVEGARFYPLDAIDLNILYSFFGVNAYAFYVFTSFCAFISIVCLFKALNLVLDRTNTAILLIILLLTSPAFVSSFLRLFVPEKLEFTLFAIFLFAFIKFNKNNSILYFIIAIVTANIALYFKEVAFIMLFAFAFFHLIFSIFTNKNNFNKKSALLDSILILSAIIWVIIYFIFVISKKTTSGKYGDTPYNQLLVFAKIFVDYILSEPFLFVGIFGILIFRIYVIFCKKEKVNPLLDASLIASALHSLAYIKLNIFNFHYPLPAYIFGLLPLGYYFRNYYKNIFIKSLFIICMVLYALSQAPTFIYMFNQYKAVPNNMQNTIHFLDSYLKDNPKTNIYLEGVNRASGGEVYHSFGSYLNFHGNKDFDLLSDIPIDNIYLGQEIKDSKYSVFRSNNIVEKNSGDLVILTLYSNLNFNEKLDSRYELLFVSDRGFNIPFLGIKTLLKYFIVKNNPSLILSQNIFHLPIHFSVYRVK